MSWRMSKRTDTSRSRARWWLGAGILTASAAVTAYFLDPVRGHGRRVRVAERTGHMARQARKTVVRKAHYVSKSMGERARHLLEPVPPAPAEGRTLLDRVESELFEDRAIPHGRLSLEVEGTTVVVRGQIDTRDQMAQIEDAIRGIAGVTAVSNLMHLPGTPAPNKAAAIAASAQARGRRGWPAEPPPDVDSE